MATESPQPETSPELDAGMEMFPTPTHPGRSLKLKHLLSDENQHVYRKLLLFIEKGVYDYVVAEALGISQTTFYRWLREGSYAKSGLKRQFWQDVTQARAKARLVKELEVARDDAKFWLRCGPGKTKQDRPGWTENIAVVGDAEADAVQVEGEFVSAVGYEDPEPSDLAQTLAVIAQLGFLEGVQAKQTLKLGQASNTVDMEESPEDFVDDDGGDVGTKGHNPERGLDVQEVSRIGPDTILPDDIPDLYKDGGNGAVH